MRIEAQFLIVSEFLLLQGAVIEQEGGMYVACPCLTAKALTRNR